MENTQPIGSELKLPVPAIICIAIGAYIVVVVIAFIIRQVLLQRGMCARGQCCGEEGDPCCECCIGCSEAFNCCRSPSLEACLDSCCPARRTGDSCVECYDCCKDCSRTDDKWKCFLHQDNNSCICDCRACKIKVDCDVPQCCLSIKGYYAKLRDQGCPTCIDLKIKLHCTHYWSVIAKCCNCKEERSYHLSCPSCKLHCPKYCKPIPGITCNVCSTLSAFCMMLWWGCCDCYGRDPETGDTVWLWPSVCPCSDPMNEVRCMLQYYRCREHVSEVYDSWSSGPCRRRCYMFPFCIRPDTLNTWNEGCTTCLCCIPKCFTQSASTNCIMCEAMLLTIQICCINTYTSLNVGCSNFHYALRDCLSAVHIYCLTCCANYLNDFSVFRSEGPCLPYHHCISQTCMCIQLNCCLGFDSSNTLSLTCKVPLCCRVYPPIDDFDIPCDVYSIDAETSHRKKPAAKTSNILQHTESTPHSVYVENPIETQPGRSRQPFNSCPNLDRNEFGSLTIPQNSSSTKSYDESTMSDTSESQQAVAYMPAVLGRSHDWIRDVNTSARRGSQDPNTSARRGSHDPNTSTLGRSCKPNTSARIGPDDPNTSERIGPDDPDTSVLARSHDPNTQAQTGSHDPDTSSLAGSLDLDISTSIGSYDLDTATPSQHLYTDDSCSIDIDLADISDNPDTEDGLC